MEIEFLTNIVKISEENIIFDSADYLDSENIGEEVKEDIIGIMESIKSIPSSGNNVFLLTTPLDGLSIPGLFKMIWLEAYKNELPQLRICVITKETADYLKDRILPGCIEDPYDLQRFIQAQNINYDQALLEIKNGNKVSHWMWYIFPLYKGLRFSATSIRYSIKSIGEAEAYLSHPVLGIRLKECSDALLGVVDRSAYEIFGSPDHTKLQSSATLFARISPYGSLFHQIIDKYFDGKQDTKTLGLIEKTNGSVYGN